MVRLYPIKLDRTRPGVPDEALLYHLLLAQAANEIIIFRKLSILSLGQVEEGSITQHAGVAITHLMILMSSGRLHEAVDLVRHIKFKDVRRAVHPKMLKDGRDAYDGFMKAMSKANAVEKLRNKAAFHIDMELAEMALKAIEPGQPLVDYLNTETGNSFFGSGAILTAFQLMTLAKNTVNGNSLDEMMDEIRVVSRNFEDYANHYLMASAIHYFGADIDTIERDAFEVNAPKLLETSISYFLDTKGVAKAFAEDAK